MPSGYLICQWSLNLMSVTITVKIDGIGTGMLDGRVVVIVYTEPNEATIRSISLRKAISHERRRYEQYLKNRLG